MIIIILYSISVIPQYRTLDTDVLKLPIQIAVLLFYCLNNITIGVVFNNLHYFNNQNLRYIFSILISI